MGPYDDEDFSADPESTDAPAGDDAPADVPPEAGSGGMEDGEVVIISPTDGARLHLDRRTLAVKAAEGDAPHSGGDAGRSAPLPDAGDGASDGDDLPPTDEPQPEPITPPEQKKKRDYVRDNPFWLYKERRRQE